jgi:hypothetical protein
MRPRLHIFFILLVPVLLGLWSCQEDDRPELCRLAYTLDFNIQPGLNTFETHVYTFSPITSQLDAALAANGYTRADVEAILPRTAILRGTFQDVNLDFIHRVSMHVYDPFDINNKIEFFYLDPVPVRNKTSIELFPGISDVTEWFERPFFGIELRLDYRQVTPSLIPMRLEFEMSVRGKN